MGRHFRFGRDPQGGGRVPSDWPQMGGNLAKCVQRRVVKGGEPRFAAIPGQWEENPGISVVASDLMTVPGHLSEAANVPESGARQVAVVRTEGLQFFHLAAIETPACVIDTRLCHDFRKAGYKSAKPGELWARFSESDHRDDPRT